MSDIAIRVEGLSKRYRIGGKQERYKTLRDTLTDAATTPFRGIRAVLRRTGSPRASEEAIWALKDVSFEIRHGEVVGIIGHNGAGKSTLLKILARITEPTSGYVDIYGRVGSLLEVGTGFHPELTGRENIYLSGAIMGMKRADIDRKFDEIVDFAEVEKFVDTPVKHYSSGMYLRLAFGVAAHLESDILLVDEVLAVGDAQFQSKCLNKMNDVASEGRTVILVSHNMAAISNLCNHSIVINGGKIQMIDRSEKAVHYYLNSINKSHDTDISKIIDKKGDRRLIFTHVRMLNGFNDVINVAASGQDLYFELQFERMSNSTLRNIIFEIKIYSGESETILSTLSTYLLGMSIPELTSDNSVRCHIPSLPLAPGAYFISLVCIVNGGIANIVDRAFQFNVVEGDYYKSGKSPKRKLHGPLLIANEWLM